MRKCHVLLKTYCSFLFLYSSFDLFKSQSAVTHVHTNSTHLESNWMICLFTAQPQISEEKWELTRSKKKSLGFFKWVHAAIKQTYLCKYNPTIVACCLVVLFCYLAVAGMSHWLVEMINYDSPVNKMSHGVELRLAQFSLLDCLPPYMSKNLIDWIQWNGKSGRKNRRPFSSWLSEISELRSFACNICRLFGFWWPVKGQSKLNLTHHTHVILAFAFGRWDQYAAQIVRHH